MIIRLGPNSLGSTKLPGTESFSYYTKEALFKYLGTNWWSFNCVYSPVHNFDTDKNKLMSIARSFNRPLDTLLGRIRVVQTLMLPCLLYKFYCLPSQLPAWFQQLQSFTNNYIWAVDCIICRLCSCINLCLGGGLNLPNYSWYDKAYKIMALCRAVKSLQRLGLYTFRVVCLFL